MTSCNLTRPDYQVIWLTGVLERLAGFGLISEPPNRLSQDAIDLFLELDSDSVRYNLFDNDKDVLALFDCIVQADSPNTPKEMIELIGDLVIEYKNNRYRLVQGCLEAQYNRK